MSSYYLTMENSLSLIPKEAKVQILPFDEYIKTHPIEIDENVVIEHYYSLIDKHGHDIAMKSAITMMDTLYHNKFNEILNSYRETEIKLPISHDISGKVESILPISQDISREVEIKLPVSQDIIDQCYDHINLHGNIFNENCPVIKYWHNYSNDHGDQMVPKDAIDHILYIAKMYYIKKLEKLSTTYPDADILLNYGPYRQKLKDEFILSYGF